MVNPTMELPAGFIMQMQKLLSDADEYFQSLRDPPPVSIRVHPIKGNKPENSQCVPWCEQGFYLAHRPSFTGDPLFHAGTYFVQEAASMFLEQFIRQTGLDQQPLMALDLCASPGGKSTHLLSLLHTESVLFANEVIRSRLGALSENLGKWGYPNVVLTNNDPADFAAAGPLFDLIVCDAPCSGEGLFRKDPSAIRFWSFEHVQHCAERQKRIIQAAWKALKPGGLLVYSTCSFNEQENEQVLKSLWHTGQAEKVSIACHHLGNIQMNSNGFSVYRLLPHRIKGEGLTVAALRKAVDKNPEPIAFQRKNFSELSEQKEPLNWIHPSAGRLIRSHQHLMLMSESLVRFFTAASGLFNIIRAGIPVAVYKGNEWLPLHEACMSIAYRRHSIPEAELSYHDALQYLQGATTFSIDSPQGVILFTYGGKPLGFARKTGRRFNNQYPRPWRIHRKDMVSKPEDHL
jgi:16S rRNA C967 or C1407 C5-methylase (RsmB/RsmF family)/NOL1/NOP2/fmu family ribosome biogenesis protein